MRAERLGTPTHAHRWEIDLGTEAVTERHGDRAFVEFPRVDARRDGSTYSYAYLVEFRDMTQEEGPRAAVVKKLNVNTGAINEHDFGPGHVAGECEFVPSYEGADEDEGFVLTLVYDRARNTSDLAVLDARDLSLCARVQLPRRVPYGFHGRWFQGGLLA